MNHLTEGGFEIICLSLPSSATFSFHCHLLNLRILREYARF
jgi:hypothetical protein